MRAATMKKIASWVNANSEALGFRAEIRDWTRTTESRSAGRTYVNWRKTYDAKRLEFTKPGESLRPIFTFVSGEAYATNSDIERKLRDIVPETMWHKFLADTNRPIDYMPGW